MNERFDILTSNCNDLIKQHFIYIAQKKEYPNSDNPACESCGCIGVQCCEHDCIDKINHCTLDRSGTCFCCNLAQKEYERLYKKFLSEGETITLQDNERRDYES